jgi:hypothetical protein
MFRTRASPAASGQFAEIAPTVNEPQEGTR